MKIIQITTFFYPVTGGVESQVEEIAQLLMENGHKVKVFTTNSSRQGHIKITQNNSNVKNIPVKRFSTWFSLSKFHKIAPSMLFGLLNEDFDILHVHGFRKFEVYIALLAAKLKGKKVVVTTHNPFTTNIRSKHLEYLVKLHDLTLGKMFSKYLDKIIALLPTEISILHGKFNIPKDKIQVIPNGIKNHFWEKIEFNKQKFLNKVLKNSDKKPDKNNWDCVILATCRLNEVKGLQNLKLASDKLKNSLFLFIGGDDGYKKQLMSIYRDNNNVAITGSYIPRTEIRKAYQIADLFVLPSLHEPFGLTPVESVASGTPVIATNVGGPKHVLSENYAIFLNPNDQESWYKNIKKMLIKNDLREKYIQLGQKDVKKYRWEKIIKRIIKLYEQLA